jgi:hypothetical protein
LIIEKFVVFWGEWTTASDHRSRPDAIPIHHTPQLNRVADKTKSPHSGVGSIKTRKVVGAGAPKIEALDSRNPFKHPLDIVEDGRLENG